MRRQLSYTIEFVLPAWPKATSQIARQIATITINLIVRIPYRKGTKHDSECSRIMRQQLVLSNLHKGMLIRLRAHVLMSEDVGLARTQNIG